MFTETLFKKWAAACEPDRLAQAANDDASWQATLANVPSQEHPTFIHMMGMPGCGKSTLAQLVYNTLNAQQAGWIWHDFDRVMQNLSGYHEDYRTYGAATAFTNWELIARAYGYKQLGALITRRAHILFDHGAANADHPSLLEWAKKQGYRVIMIQPQVTQEVAAQRVTDRARQQGGRFTPLEYLMERHALLEDMLPTYNTIAQQIIKIDNNEPVTPAHIANILQSARL